MLAVTRGSMSAQQNKIQDLPLSVTPSTLCIPHERAAYLWVHIWDDIDFADTLRSHHPAFMEQNFVNFLSLFPHAQAEARIMAVKSLMQRAEVDETPFIDYWHGWQKNTFTLPAHPCRMKNTSFPFWKKS